MHALEYKKLRTKFLGTQAEAAKILGCSQAAITDRERRRDGDTVTPAAELALLRAVAARLLGVKALMPRIKPELTAKRKAHIAKLAASNTRRGRAAAKDYPSSAAPALAGFSRRVKPAPPSTCAFVDSRTGTPCTRPVEALPDALLCPAHGSEAGWLGLKRFK
jgi:DNA-binding XRE family transcriptional regulator